MIKMSKRVSSIAKALIAFQGEVADIVKDSKGQFAYASLAAVLQMVRPLATKCGFAIVPGLVNTPENPDIIGIETMLLHESGESISAVVYRPVDPKQTRSIDQAGGTTISYYRRYSLMTVLNLVQRDDDGQEDFEPVSLQKKPQPRALNAPSYDKLMQIAKELKIGGKQMSEWLEKYEVEELSDLSEPQLKQIISSIEE